MKRQNKLCFTVFPVLLIAALLVFSAPARAQDGLAVSRDGGLVDSVAAMMPGAGHFLMLESPEEFNKQLDAIIEDIVNKEERISRWPRGRDRRLWAAQRVCASNLTNTWPLIGRKS